MRKKKKGLIITAVTVLAIALVLSTLFIIFNLRAPVIIVTEQYFIDLYGEKRFKKDINNASITLLRPVKAAVIANDAGDDIAPYTIAEISSKPYCVLFPRRFAQSARLYREQNPEAVIILLEGRLPINTDVSGLTVYGTDTENDYYKAGLIAATIAASASDEETKGKIAVFLMPGTARDAFLRGIKEEGTEYETKFYTSYTDISSTPALACVILAGTGGEILDKIPEIPVIAFSWLDPSMMTDNVILVIDDSPLAQLVQAVNMAVAVKAQEAEGEGEKTGGEERIGSKFIVSERKIFDSTLLQNISKMK